MSGTFRICALPAGTLPTPTWATTFGANDTELIDLGFYVWIVTDGAVTGLVDLGLPLDEADLMALSATNRNFAADGFGNIRLLPDLLGQAGVAATDIDFVLVTQTISYHSGGLDARLLPNATFFLSAAGVREMLEDAPGHPPVEFYFTDRAWSSLRQLAIEGRLRLVDSLTEVAPGVTFETTGGHHPGSAAVRITTKDGVVGLVETSFLQADLDRGVPIGIAEDVAACRRTIQRYARECWQAVAIHDPANAVRFAPNRADPEDRP